MRAMWQCGGRFAGVWPSQFAATQPKTRQVVVDFLALPLRSAHSVLRIC
jgi:hypothetical protein